MKWATVAGSGILALIMAAPLAMAEEATATQQQNETMEQKQLRLEQRFQKRSQDGEGMQYRYEERMRHRTGGDDGKQGRYEEKMQRGSTGNGQGGGARR